MNWYKKAQANYLGDCRSINIWDATEIAQLIENSENITTEVAMSYIKNLPKSFYKRQNDFSFGKNKNILWAYDDLKDIHYFYELV